MVWGGLRWFGVVCGNSMVPLHRFPWNFSFALGKTIKRSLQYVDTSIQSDFKFSGLIHV